MQDNQTIVATIVSAQNRAQELAECAMATLAKRSTACSPLRVLDPLRAVDLVFEAPLDDDLDTFLRLALDDLEAGPFDLAVQPVDQRFRQALIADMESTVIENEMLDELAEDVGVGERVAEITARAMNGELDFRQALDERVGLLKGLGEDVLETCRGKIRMDAGAHVLFATLHHHGVATALVSGGFETFAQPVAAELGINESQANRLEWSADRRLTGRVLEPVLDRDAKVLALEGLCSRLSLRPSDVATIGDGANDLPMLRASGFGVAYRGKPHVRRGASYSINHGDLSTLLFYLGYPRSAWVDPI